MVTGYGAEGIEEFNLDRKLGLELIYNPKWDGDPVESLRCGTKDLDDDALIIFGDVLANSHIFRRFLECETPLAWIKTIIPWGGGLPDDEVYRADRQVCIVKISNEILTIFEKEKAEGYLTRFAERCLKSMTTERDGNRLNALLLEGMYRNGPVEEIIIPSPIMDIDRYRQTDEGNPNTSRFRRRAHKNSKLGLGQKMEQSREREGEPPVFSIVIPISHGEGNRVNGPRLRNCMKSVVNQTLQPLEIIVADYGSTEDGHEEIMKILEPFDCSVYYYPDTDGIWNLSKARNMGIRRSQCENFAAVDADVILEPRVVEVLSQAHASRLRSYISCFLRMLLPEENPHFTEFIQNCVAGGRSRAGCIAEYRKLYPDNPDGFQLPRDFAKLRNIGFWASAGWGGLVSAPRDWFFKVRGFDERMRFWGGEDADMWKRAGLDNMDRYRINDLEQEDTEIYHQFHDDCLSWDQSRLTEEEAAQIRWNRLLAKKDFTLMRNNDIWGLWQK